MKFWKRLFFVLLIVLFGWGIWGKEIGKEQTDEQTTEKALIKPIKFAVMSDVHSDWDNFRKALNKAKLWFDKGDGFVIITGDLTTLGLENELISAKKILDESQLKYYVIPGNHDVWWGRKNKTDVWRAVFGKSFQSFKDDGVKFILINNGDGVGGIDGFGGVSESGEKQMVWLSKEAEECLKLYCLIFMHMPLNHPGSLHVMGEDNTEIASEAGKIKELLVKDKIEKIFAGHLHFSSSYELESLKTIIVGAITSDRNLQSPKFMTVEIINGKLVQNDVFLSD